MRSIETLAAVPSKISQKEFDRLPLGTLKQKFFEAQPNPDVKEMFDEINDERIFLIHKFFQVFPVAKLNGNEEAAHRLKRIDEILGAGNEILSRAFEGALALSKIPRPKFREALAFVVDDRKKAKISE